MRDWIDQLSFRARTAIIIVVFVLTMLAMMDNSAQLLADLGKVVFVMAVNGSPPRLTEVRPRTHGNDGHDSDRVLSRRTRPINQTDCKPQQSLLQDAHFVSMAVQGSNVPP
jgi:hypothetical protein